MFDFSTQALIEKLTRLMIIFLVLPVHEFAHAWTAKRLGDDTAEYQGRLTLNPIAHIDLVGGLLLFFTGFGWAKPVPVDPLRFNRKHTLRGGMALTAVAGPLSNLIAALLGMNIIRIFTLPQFAEIFFQADIETKLTFPLMLYYFLFYFIQINIGLAVFNLLPVPPLDGSKVLAYFLPNKANGVIRWIEQNQMIVYLVFIVLLNTSILQIPLSWLSNLIFDALYFLTGWIPLLFG